MKKRRLFSAWILVLVLAAGVLGGCGKKNTEETETSETSGKLATASELVEQARDALAGADSMSGQLSIEMAMDYSAQGVEATLECKVSQDMEMVRKPEAAHMKGTININLSGITVDTESYAVKEGDSYVTYTKSAGQGLKQTADSADTQADASKTLDMLLKNSDSLTMEETQGEGGKKLYQVSGVIEGGDFSKLLDPSVGGLTSEDSYGDLDAAVTLTVDGESGIPSAISIDLTESYNAFMQANREAEGFDEITVTAFCVTMSGYVLNGLGEITVPEEVKASAMDMDALETSQPEESETSDPEEPESKDFEIQQNESGEYVLGTSWDDSTANIAVPAGFSYDAGSDKTWLKFNSKENDGVHELSLVYSLYTLDDNYGEEDLAQVQESTYAYMLTSGDYAKVSMEPQTTVTAGGRTVSYTKLSYLYLGTIYCEEYNSWTVLSDGRMIQCTVKEESREEACDRIDPEEILETAFAALKN